MEQDKCSAQQAEGIVVFVLGWASGPEAVGHLHLPGGYDVLTLYDWRTMPCGATLAGLRREVAGYADRRLAAWSFGVWAAEQLFAGMEFTRAVAFNGTPLPADDALGMGLRRLKLTLRGLPAGRMDDFLRRASCPPGPRSLQDNIAELETLTRLSAEPYTPSLAWDMAVAGSGDLIFPPENMARYWGDKAKNVPLPHYPFEHSAPVVAALQL